MKKPAQRDIVRLQDIPNIGRAMESNLIDLGITRPRDLIGRDPYQLYNDLCKTTQYKVDPCVLDIFISAVRYMEGQPAKKWWEYTAERKKHTQ